MLYFHSHGIVFYKVKFVATKENMGKKQSHQEWAETEFVGGATTNNEKMHSTYMLNNDKTRE